MLNRRCLLTRWGGCIVACTREVRKPYRKPSMIRTNILSNTLPEMAAWRLPFIAFVSTILVCCTGAGEPGPTVTPTPTNTPTPPPLGSETERPYVYQSRGNTYVEQGEHQKAITEYSMPLRSTRNLSKPTTTAASPTTNWVNTRRPSPIIAKYLRSLTIRTLQGMPKMLLKGWG